MITRVIASAMVVTAVAALAASLTETTKLDFGGVTALEARTFNGSITLKTSTEAFSLKTVKLGEATVSFGKRGTVLVIEAKTGTPVMPNARVDLEMRVPAGLAVTLATGNGNVQTNGVVKNLRLDVGNGDARIEDARNTVITVRSGNGNVVVRGSSGRLDAVSGNGRVSIESFSFAPGTRSLARTSNGSVAVLAPNAPDGLSITGTTSTGRLNLCLPGYDVKTDSMVVGGRFSALKTGTNAATLELTVGNGDIVINPSLLIGNCN
jgi:DUF4097 and DUF4098 domain-containing protein YvlB